MNGWQISLAIGAFFAVLISQHKKRSSAWVLIMTLSFLSGVLWQRASLPYQAFANGAFDGALCLSIYFFGKFDWEMKIFRIFQVSVLISLIRLSGYLPDHLIYVSILEACNWAALAVIGGTGAIEWSKRNAVGFNHHPRGIVLRNLHSLCEKRTDTPWHKA